MRRAQRGKRNRGGHGGGGMMQGRGGFSGQGRSNSGEYDRRARADAQKKLEKYLNLARDAQLDGDIIQAENWFQHADHYQRVINACDEQDRQFMPQRVEQPLNAEPAETVFEDDGPASQGQQQPAPERGYTDRPERSENRERQQREGRPERSENRERGERFRQPWRERNPQPVRQQEPDEPETLDVPFLMNAPQPVIRFEPEAVTPSPAVAVPAAAAEEPAAPAPRRRGRPRKKPLEGEGEAVAL